MKKLSKIFCYTAAGLVLAACSDDFTPPEDTIITTPEVSVITESSATVTMTAYGRSVHENSVGVCYGTEAEPTIENSKVTRSRGVSVNVTLTDLEELTTYYLRTFAETDYGIKYSDVVTFTTLGHAHSLETWTAPAYADDYRSISGWSQRAQWNLANVHDPTVMLADDGYYYMYQTDASYGNAHTAGGHFHARRSKNLIDWEYLGGVMTNAPAWVLTKLNEIRVEMGLPASSVNPNDYGYWAPCARKVREGLYRMYYCIVVPGTINGEGTWSERSFIGMMETSDPASNNWEDKGFVITNFSDKGLNYNVAQNNYANCYFKYNAIDPSFIITPEGEHWLIYGSWHSGFAAVQLNAETGKTIVDPLPNPWGADNEAAYGKRIFTRAAGDRWQGSEAPEVIYHDGYYYLFMAYDALDVPYNTRVVRSQHIDGPYVNASGSDCTNGADAITVVTHPYQFSGSQGWVGISHCAVFDDGQGNYFYASQQRFPESAGGNAPNAVMLGGVRGIQWQSNGWPVVMPERYAAVPQVAITEDELVGTWENIDLSYSYGNMKTSETMTLAAGGTVSGGTWNGKTWSFDASSNTLTINGVALKVQRECDWEASPRKHTIVYAGTSGNKTYWGKKK
jgi:beta-xylosidase